MRHQAYKNLSVGIVALGAGHRRAGGLDKAFSAAFGHPAPYIVTFGGVLGVAIGWGVTAGIQSLPLLGPLFKDTSGRGDIHLEISRFAVITSTLVLEAIGLAAGLWPALKASRLDPIEALRYE